MGLNTEFRFKARLEDSLPDAAVEMFKRILIDRTWKLDKDYELERPQIDHSFFDCKRWLSLLSNTFDLLEPFDGKFNIEPDGSMVLDIYTSFKNYDREVEHFINWISPFIIPCEENKNIGWYKYEDEDQKKLLFYSSEKKTITNE